eukprot:CAMPEP_0183453304 /NCGR_PEP_ID=MMETSP0370-20130417/120561_1 /TAXON_ID=268820 /ORGANISM="Peridinium aciculiferum, Strain PAER-2" /LENGTH=66 /DNA_ID=CAMNT_0025644685 /DNA_START=80 /DNA_END=280 /DNA_ORIENTATION=+
MSGLKGWPQCSCARREGDVAVLQEVALRKQNNGRGGITHGHENAHVGRMQLRDVVCWRRKRDVRAV